MKTVMIIAGESSGEMYGSLLAKAIKSLWPDVRLIGIGGERMKASGVEILSGISSALGLIEVVSSLKKIRKSFRSASRALQELSPDVLVLIDYPDFNFRVAKIARRYGLKVLYYVSPQVWAWRKGRIKTMAEIADRVAVILPFEEEIYRNAGISCEFVGHPAMEEIEQSAVSLRPMGSQSATRGQSEIQNKKSKIGSHVISLLPGSRPNELKSLLPVYIDLVRLLREVNSNYHFIMPVAPNIDTGAFKSDISILEREGVICVKDDVIGALASSDAAVIASGTATLQAALLGIPMVVVYKLSLLTYLLGRAILDVKYISLVNILAGRGIVSELIQESANAEGITEELRKIMRDDAYRANMISSLERIKKLFSGKRPSLRVAEMIGDMAGWAD